MADHELLKRVVVNPDVFGGQPCIRGTRVSIAVVLGSLAEGLTPQQVMDHFPQISIEDIHAALAYAALLAEENTWKLAV